MKRRTFFLFTALVFPVLLIIFLWILYTKKTTEKNGFKRNFIDGTLREKAILQTKSHEVFAFSKSMLLLRDIKQQKIDLIRLGDLKTKNILNSKIVGAQVFCKYMDGLLFVFYIPRKEILVYDSTGNLLSSTTLDQSFIRGAPISKVKAIVRSSSPDGMNRFIRQINLSDNSTIDENWEPFKLDDAGLQSDGQLHYDKKSAKIVYTFFYGNGIVTVDTNLALKSIIRTIDTLNSFTADIVKRSGYITHTGPPKPVSIYSAVNEGKVYIHSGLKADNETTENFSNNSVVDVYDLEKGRYLYSFYIPKKNGKRASRFFISENKLAAQYDDVTSIYHLNHLLLGLE